jgi:hypothetical protein
MPEDLGDGMDWRASGAAAYEPIDVMRLAS